MQAAKALAPSVRPPSHMDDDLPMRPPFSSTWIQFAENSERANASVFALARPARSKPSAQFRSSIPSPTINIGLFYHNDMRNLAATLWDGAVFSHLGGNDDEAVERLLDSLHVARSLRQDDFWVTQLMAGGVENRICTAARVIFSDPKPGGRPTTRPVTAPKVKLLIAQLLDEQVAREGVERGLVIDQLLYIDYFSDVSKENWILRPLAQQEIIRSLQNADVILRASRCTSLPEADAVLKEYRPEKASSQRRFGPSSQDTNLPRYSRWFRDWDRSETYVNRIFRNLAERRSAAIALAISLYRADHGRLPPDLAALVPDYLSTTPKDPLYADGRAIGYVIRQFRNGIDRPLLYFGAGVDELPQDPIYEWHPPKQKLGDVEYRQYRDLTTFDPAVLKKAVDNQPDKPNAPGQNPQ
jgi:hypothetical protein